MEIAKIIKGNVRPSEVLRIWAFRKQNGKYGTVDIASMPPEKQLFEYLASEQNRASGSLIQERALGFSDTRMHLMEAKNNKEKGIEDQEIEEEFENIEGIEEVIETKVFPSWEPTKEEMSAQRYLELKLRKMCKEELGPLPYARPRKLEEFGDRSKFVLQLLENSEDHEEAENRSTNIRDGWNKTIEIIRKSKNMTQEEREESRREFINKIRTPKSKKKRNESTT